MVGEAGDVPVALLRKVRASPTRTQLPLVDIRMPPSHTDEGLQAAQADPPRASRHRRPLCSPSTSSLSYALRLLEEHPEGVGYLQVRTVCRAGHLGGDRRGLRPYAGPALVLSCVVSAQAGMATAGRQAQ